MRTEREEPEYNYNNNPQSYEDRNETMRNGEGKNRQKKKRNSK